MQQPDPDVQPDAAKPTLAASFRLLSRAFACSSRTIAESISSMPAPTMRTMNDLRLIRSGTDASPMLTVLRVPIE
jgi:hypothetical protein